ncbi:hypothetical protein, partial [Streptomyces sp. MB09-02B]|uniref:hypothetical protein n=1 Tax=Streptomyces sp. MB09-02B TaxID=3028667 RepID=UPI0029A1FB85
MTNSLFCGIGCGSAADARISLRAYGTTLEARGGTGEVSSMRPLDVDEPTVVGPYRLLGRLGAG